MKKLKAWQIVLLVIFYPIGIIYLLVWLASRDKQQTEAAPAAAAASAPQLEVLTDFYSKVVGVTFNNDDGSSRQKNIAACKAGQGVIFRPVEVKGHPEAVAVFTENGKQLGNLNAELAAELRGKYATNAMQATIAEVTGGAGDKPTYGCNLHIIIYKATK